MLSPQSVLGVANNPPTSLSLLAERLTCLELHIDDSTDLDIRMRALGSFSKHLFTSATNLEAVHIGFPQHRPLNIRLDELFHGLKWNKLGKHGTLRSNIKSSLTCKASFGIQAWRLEAEEIIDLARRHRETLRGLRLRDVLLKDGSRWKDVLAVLREEMKQLNWVSLRRIDYAKHFDDTRILGAEIPDESLIGSDSSDEDDWDMPDEDDGYNEHVLAEDLADGSNGSMPDSDLESDIGTDEPEQGGSIHFPPYPDTPVSVPCCNGHMDSAEALGDDGICVTNSQRYGSSSTHALCTDLLSRKWWEKWCVNKVCSEHQHK